MTWQFIWNKIEAFGMLFLFLILMSIVWRLVLGKKISSGIGEIPKLISSWLKTLWPILEAILKGLWTFVKWLFWVVIDGCIFVFRALQELVKLLREQAP